MLTCILHSAHRRAASEKVAWNAHRGPWPWLRHLGCGTLAAMASTPKRKRSGITPDSCGKAGDPHNLEGGALASRNSSISIKRRRAFDAGWDLAADEAGSSSTDAILAA